MPIKPITPRQALSSRDIPDFVIDAFNRMIQEKVDSTGTATFTQEEIVQKILNSGINRTEIFQKGYLDVESVYRQAGWDVEFDRPGYNETYPARFTFTRRER